jgi:hypothetical protein
LAAAHAFKGEMDQAKTALAEARRINPKLSVKWLIESRCSSVEEGSTRRIVD